MKSQQFNVSCRAIEHLVVDFPNWDKDYAEKLGYKLSFLRDLSRSISWEEFVQFLTFYAETYGECAINNVQRDVVLSKQLSGMKVLRLMASPTTLYKLHAKWMGPMMFPCVHSSIFPLSDTKLEIRLETPLPASRAMMEATPVFLSYLPTLIGYPAANVVSNINGTKASYIIDLPLSRTIFSKFTRLFRLLAGGQHLVSELALQQDQLRTRNTELKQTSLKLGMTKENLRDAKEQFQLAVAGSNDGIWDWDLRTDKMFFSERWKVIMGFGPSHRASERADWFHHVLDEDLDALKAAIDAHITGESVFLNHQFRIDAPCFSTTRWGLVKGKVILDRQGKPYRMAGSLSDTTELVHVSKDLDFTIQSYHALLKHSPDGALIYNEKEILSTNPAMLKFLGYPRESDLVGHSLLKITDSFATFFEPQIRRLRGDEGSIVSFLSAENTVKEGEVSGLKVQFDKKIVNCILVRDVTQRRILEERLQAVERVIAVGTMASGIAHEINNPMAYIHSNVEFVRSELSALKDTLIQGDVEPENIVGIVNDLDAALADTLNGSQRVRTIVKDLKSLSHSSENEALEVVDVLAVIETSMAIVKRKLSNETNLITRFDHTPPALFSTGRLGQVLLNLLINAAHSIQSSSRGDNEICISTDHTDDEVFIRIIDTGTGIPEKVRSKIFDPFFTTKPTGAGTGLGLSICYNIMKRLGGNLTFETELGVGTTFTIHLPRAPEDSIEESNVSATTHHILVIDDDEKIGLMMQRLLQPIYRVTYVNSALEGLSTLDKKGDIDLIICDAMMPDVSGYDLLDKLKVNHLTMMAHFILMTGGTLETNRFQQYKDTFGTPVLYKPFDLDVLKNTISQRVIKPFLQPDL